MSFAFYIFFSPLQIQLPFPYHYNSIPELTAILEAPQVTAAGISLRDAV